MHKSSKLTVGLGDRAYDIVVGRGLITRADELAGDILTGRHAIIISDDNVASLHAPALAAACDRICRRYDQLTVPAGESSKSMPVLETLLEDILDLGVDRDVI